MTKAPSVIAGAGIAALPILFGLVRYATATDARYLMVAGVSTLGAGLVLSASRPRGVFGWRRLVRAFLVAMVFGVVLARAQGAGSGVAIAFVCGGFALCGVAGIALVLRGVRMTRRDPQ